MAQDTGDNSPQRRNTPSFRIATSIAGLVLALFSLGSEATAADYTMKISTPPINELQHEWMKRYEAALEEKTGGKIDVQIYPASQLGPTNQVIESVQLGLIEATMLPAEFLIGVDPRFQILALPGLFKDIATARATLDKPEVRKAFFDIGLTKGLKGISAIIYGGQAFATRKPITSLADFQGQRIRVLASETETGVVSALGGAPVPMPLNEVIPGLQQGTIDGVSSVLGPLASFRAWEVAPHLTETNLWLLIPVTVVSTAWLESLPEDLRTAVIETGGAIEAELHAWQLERMQRDRAAWTAGGGKISSLPPSDQSKAEDAASKVAKEFLVRHPDINELYNRITGAAPR